MSHFTDSFFALLTRLSQFSLPKMWFAFLALGLIAELVRKAERGQPLRDVLFNVKCSLVYLVAIFVLSPGVNLATSALASSAGLGWIDLDIFSHASVAGQIGAALLSVTLLDFFYYWWHRSQHTFPFLWDQHAVHHSDESFNISTNMRHHWSEFVFQSLMVGLPMAVLFKLTPVNMWIMSMTMAAWTWFIHMNIRLHLGRFSWLICGPQIHRLHHSRLSHHFDKNFAAYTPIWDVLFGTYYAPARDEYPPTGVDGVRIGTVTQAAVYPFARWWEKAAQKLSAGAKPPLPGE